MLDRIVGPPAVPESLVPPTSVVVSLSARSREAPCGPSDGSTTVVARIRNADLNQDGEDQPNDLPRNATNGSRNATSHCAGKNIYGTTPHTWAHVWQIHSHVQVPQLRTRRDTGRGVGNCRAPDAGADDQVSGVWQHRREQPPLTGSPSVPGGQELLQYRDASGGADAFGAGIEHRSCVGPGADAPRGFHR